MRLDKVAKTIILENQFDFIPKTRIHDCSALASDGVNCLNCQTHGRNMAIKLDIHKAFDTVDWKFLLAILDAFGFSNTFTTWIHNILKSICISVLINRSPSGYFPSSQGVQQGDLLLPLLFCISEEVFSRYISYSVDNRLLHPIVAC